MNILDIERLRLRTIEIDGAAFYYELVNDPTWLEFIGDRVYAVSTTRAATISCG